MPTSKRKRPIVHELFAPGLKPDVRLKVFGTSEYHVHSVLLKLYSGFFLKFLDSPEKKVPASPEFAYEWITQIDDDDGWHLVAAQAAPQKTGSLHDQKKQSQQEDAFHALIQAIYNMPYMIYRAEELAALFELADYYCALRIVSRTLDEAITYGEEEGVFWGLKENPCRFLQLAISLRNERLFKECLCLSLGPWTDPVFRKGATGEVWQICEKACSKIYARMGRVNERLLKRMHQLARNDPAARDKMLEYMKKVSLNFTDSSPDKMYLPQYYRKLWNFKSNDGKQLFRDAMEGLIDNTLTLARDSKAGQGDFIDFFLCESLEYEEIPWDLDEDHW
ncbi:uncharacterized protein PAC_05401 [Phialocephala subalpina]|uniref:BTB domain-containing protein n=1 Tax=Phialocephala subalpina TaxID=576137 RepID=A0A1L7WRW7_9HELO|nr:uncharacterized protein PAC_05401 [Phialocephala subalpina]